MGHLTTLLPWELTTNAQAACAPFPFPPFMKEAIAPNADLWQLNQAMAVMEQQRGVTAQKFFRKVLAAKLILRRPNGEVIGKTEFLQTLNLPTLFTDYELEVLEELPVLRTNRQALVTALVRTQDRYASVRHFRHIRLFTCTRTGWKLEFWYICEDICP